MFKFRDFSLKRKLVTLIMASTELALVAFLLLGTVHYYVTTRDDEIGEFSTDTQILSEVIAAAVVFNDKAAAAGILDGYRRKADTTAIDVFDKDGNLFASAAAAATQTRLSADQAFALLSHEPIPTEHADDHLHYLQMTPLSMAFVAPVMLHKEQIGVVVCYVSLQPMFRELLSYIGLALVIMLTISVAAYFVSGAMQRLITRPIARMVTAIQAITHDGRYDARVEKTSDDELGALIDHFNVMLAEIDRRDRQLAGHRDELERTVELRTEALTVSNARLAVALEAAEQARLAAERASRAKSQFLANMSHEIRTPMHGVLGNLELLRKTPLSERQQRLVQTINASGTALLGIISDILDVSKIESAKLSLERSDFDAWRTIEEVCELFARTAAEKGLALTLSLPPELPRYLCGDVTRLRQILTNLLSNAVKFTEAGEIAVTVAVAGAPSAGGDVGLRISVRDTGIGITEDARAKIFDAFAQADDSTTRRFGGTGLGLAICKELVRLMGGDIGVDADPGAGSTFWFTARFQPARTAPSPLPAGGRALVVGGDAGERVRLAACLGHWGLAVEPAATLAAASHDWRSADPVGGYALVVIDLPALAEGDRALLEAWLADGPAVPVVLLHEPDQAPARTGGGAVGHLPKPLRRSTLYDCIVTVLRRAASGDGGGEAEAAAETGHGGRAARVLVAEDNAVNQELARDCLEMMGCAVAIVGNGREAVAAVRQAPWDLLLMDCHMPELDGFEATLRIRDDERQRPGQRRLPIVALTASATREDRDRCIAVGMDDYLSKPFTPDQLAAVLDRWLGERPPLASTPAAVVAAPRQPTAVVDPQALANIRAMQRQGRPSVLDKAIGLFLEQAPAQLAAMAAALADGDAARLRLAAHTLKSSSAYLGATALSERCKQIETLGRDDDLAAAAALVAEAVASFDNVREALAAERGKAA